MPVKVPDLDGMRPITCIGSAGLDYIVSGVDALPGRGESARAQAMKIEIGGMALNCAIALCKLGVPAYAITRIGRDREGDALVKQLGQLGLEEECLSGCVRDNDVRTLVSVVLVESSEGKERTMIAVGGDAAQPTIDDLRRHQELMQKSRFCHFTSLGAFPALERPEVVPLLNKIAESGAEITADALPTNTLQDVGWRRAVGPFLSCVDYFLPSDVEATLLTELEDPHEAARAIQDTYGIANVCIKLRDRGAIVRIGERSENIPAFLAHEKDVVDRTGCGDAWCAGFLARLYTKDDPIDAAYFGNAAAYYCLRSVGATAGIPTLKSLQELVESRRPSI